MLNIFNRCKNVVQKLGLVVQKSYFCTTVLIAAGVTKEKMAKIATQNN